MDRAARSQPLGRCLLAPGVVLAVLALLAACAPRAAPAPAAGTPGVGAQPPGAPEPVTAIKLGMVSASWSSQLPVAIAQDLGFFRDEGVAIEQQTVPSGGP